MRRHPMSRVLSWIGIGAVAAGLLAAVPATASAASTLAWQPCGNDALDSGGFECATLTVPKDRRHPKAGTVTLAVIRHASVGTPDQRIGSLVFNPGGPGGSGVQSILPVWSLVPDEIKARFDLVSWDPRGVGSSVPALSDCETPWPVRPATGPVDWAKVASGFRRTLAEANAQCQAKNAEIVPFMGTNENVADLDRLRAALGESKLTYWGMSYGTRIGYAYAVTYPGNVRAIVLDGSIDPASTTLSLSEGGSAPDQAFGAFADAYPLAGAQIKMVLASLNKATVPLPGGRRLTRWDVIDLIYGGIAQQGSYADISTIAAVYYTTVFGTGEAQAQAAAIAKSLVGVARSQPNSNAGGVFSVVNCLDYAGRPTLRQAVAAITAQRRYGPVNGGSTATAYSLGCSGLTVKPDPIPLITGQGPNVPLLILGASRDGSTIQTWTGRMSQAFPMSRTVTYAGGQHVTWGFAGSDCVDAVANAYVTTLVLPAMDVGCPNAYQPAS